MSAVGAFRSTATGAGNNFRWWWSWCLRLRDLSYWFEYFYFLGGSATDDHESEQYNQQGRDKTS